MSILTCLSWSLGICSRAKVRLGVQHPMICEQELSLVRKSYNIAACFAGKAGRRISADGACKLDSVCNVTSASLTGIETPEQSQDRTNPTPATPIVSHCCCPQDVVLFLWWVILSASKYIDASAVNVHRDVCAHPGHRYYKRLQPRCVEA